MRGTGIKLSIFTIFTIIITVGLATVIGNFSLTADTYQVKAVFDDATGVLNGDLVKIAGVDVGRVTGFEVSEGQATVTLQLNKEIQVPENVIAEIKFRNLLGQRIVNLVEPDQPSNEMLEPDAVIPSTQTRPALDLDLVFNNLRPLIQSTNPDDINTVARSVLAIFEGRENQFGNLLGNIGDLTHTLADEGRFSRLITSLNDVTELLNGQSESIKTGLSEFTSFTEDLADLTPQIENIVTQLDGASRKFSAVLTRNRDNIDQELSDLAALLGVIDDNLGPLDRATKNLKEVLMATARSQSYGKWWNLYVVNLCPETGTGECSLVTAGEE